MSTLRELFDSKVQLRFDADPDQQVEARMTVHGLPGLRYAKMVSRMNVSLERPRQMLSDREDDVCLIVSTGGRSRSLNEISSLRRTMGKLSFWSIANQRSSASRP